MVPSLDLVLAPGDGNGVVLRFAEEVAQVDSEDAADALEGRKRGDHVIGFEFGEQGGRAVSLRGQSTQGEVLRGAKRTQFETDGVNGQRIYGRGSWRRHDGEMVAGYCKEGCVLGHFDAHSSR